MEEMQAANQAIDVSEWNQDEEFAECPEGARDKTLLYCPASPPYHFLNAGQRYLFKRSSHRYPEQFWAEIIAYLLGSQLQIPVPPTFVAYDSKKKQSGALTQWFLKQNKGIDEVYIAGGDYCQQYIPDFDRKTGKQHNFMTITEIFGELPTFNEDWKSYWAKVFFFDALIGNTDRHQDNWGTIGIGDPPEVQWLAPVFDNGTSMGHEISSNKFKYYEDLAHLEKYVAKGSHHIKWDIQTAVRARHFELLKMLSDKYPETRIIMINCLKKVNPETFKAILDKLITFHIPIKLSTERAFFMLNLLKCRYQQLFNEFGD